MAYCVVRHLLEESVVAFFYTYLLKCRSEKLRCNEVVERLLDFVLKDVPGLPRFNIRPLSLSLPLAQRICLTNYTRNEVGILHKNFQACQHSYKTTKELVQMCFDDILKIGKVRTLFGIAHKLEKLGLILWMVKTSNKAGVAGAKTMAEHVYLKGIADSVVALHPTLSRTSATLRAAFLAEAKSTFKQAHGRELPPLPYNQISDPRGYLGLATLASSIATGRTTNDARQADGDLLASQPSLELVKHLHTWVHSAASEHSDTAAPQGFMRTATTYLAEQSGRAAGVQTFQRVMGNIEARRNGTKAWIRDEGGLTKARTAATKALDMAAANGDRVYLGQPSLERTLGPAEFYELRKIMFDCFIRGKENLGVKDNSPQFHYQTPQYQAFPHDVLAKLWIGRIEQRFRSQGGYQPGMELTQARAEALIKKARLDSGLDGIKSWNHKTISKGWFSGKPKDFFRAEIDKAVKDGMFAADEYDTQVDFLLGLEYRIENPAFAYEKKDAGKRKQATTETDAGKKSRAAGKTNGVKKLQTEKREAGEKKGSRGKGGKKRSAKDLDESSCDGDDLHMDMGSDGDTDASYGRPASRKRVLTAVSGNVRGSKRGKK